MQQLPAPEATLLAAVMKAHLYGSLENRPVLPAWAAQQTSPSSVTREG